MSRFDNHCINPSIDIIPLQSSSGEKRKFMDSQERSRNPEGSNRNYREQILSRVQNYLYENEDKVYIDVNEMADHLQKKYRDYRTKKRGQFRRMVRQAYDEITECITKKANVRWNDEDEEEVDIESDPQDDMNASGDLLMMYKKLGKKRNGNSSDKELIDISSDSDNTKVDEAPLKRMKMDSNKLPKKTHNDAPPPQENTNTNIEERTLSYVQEKPTKKRQKDKGNEAFLSQKKNKFASTISKKKLADFCGNPMLLLNVKKSLVHFKRSLLGRYIPTKGLLLCGPSGCGKTLLAHAVAGELKYPLIKVSTPELISGISGETESNIRDLFAQAQAAAPCVLLFEEIDAIVARKDNAQNMMGVRIVSQFVFCFDELNSDENVNKVLVLGTTSRPEALDPALRGPERFGKEIYLGIPDKDTRNNILKLNMLKLQSSELKLAADVDLLEIASLTPGFVGTDLIVLINEAINSAVDRALKTLKQKPIVQEVQKENVIINPSERNNEKPVEETITDIAEEEVQITELKTDQQTNNKETEKSEEISIEVEKQTETSTPSTSMQNTAIVIDEVQIEEATKSDEVIIQKPIVEEPDDSVPIKNNKLSNKEIEELSELYTSWINDDTEITHEQLSQVSIEKVDFLNALAVVQPLGKIEGFTTVPDVTWDDVGSLQHIREELFMSIIAPVKYSEKIKKLGIKCSSGVLLCGPPGCGKTLLAKAIANEAEINFISVNGPELLNMYLGESERAVRQCFTRAKNSAPCIIFFDEIESLCRRRSQSDHNESTSRLVNQFLTEMDGINSRNGVFLMAATNRPDIIDDAVLRPGRLDQILYVGLPNAADRRDILMALTKNGTDPELSKDVNLDEISCDSRCEGFTGADLASLIQIAARKVLEEFIKDPEKETDIICKRHIYAALHKIKPSVQEKDMKYYLKFKKMYSDDDNSIQDVPMQTPENLHVDQPCVDTTMEAMET